MREEYFRQLFPITFQGKKKEKKTEISYKFLILVQYLHFTWHLL